MGDGPYYVMERTFYLCHLEIMKTLKRVLSAGEVLLDNSKNPKISVATIAKKDIKKGIGSFEVRGECIRIIENKQHLPIGLCSNATIKRDIKAGELYYL